METFNDNDKKLKQFFGENKREIEDNGFTQRVMRKLPEQPDRSWIVWVFACTGLVISLLLALYTGLIQSILLYLQLIPVYYLLAAVFLFPLIGSIGIFYAQKKNPYFIARL